LRPNRYRCRHGYYWQKKSPALYPMLQSSSPYDLSFSHNTSVTDKQIDGGNHTNSSTVTSVRSFKNRVEIIRLSRWVFKFETTSLSEKRNKTFSRKIQWGLILASSWIGIVWDLHCKCMNTTHLLNTARQHANRGNIQYLLFVLIIAWVTRHNYNYYQYYTLGQASYNRIEPTAYHTQTVQYKCSGSSYLSPNKKAPR